MIVCIARLEVRLPGCQSLKDKRQIVRSWIQKRRQEGAVSISEVADHDLWGNATIGIALVHAQSVDARQWMERIHAAAESNPEWDVAGWFVEEFER